MSADREVLYFQAARRRRSSGTVPELLEQMEVPAAEGGARVPLQNAFAIFRRRFESALARAGVTKDAVAKAMGISPTLLSRQLQNVDNQHPSAVRILLAPEHVQREYLIEWMTDSGLFVVRRSVSATFEEQR